MAKFGRRTKWTGRMGIRDIGGARMRGALLARSAGRTAVVAAARAGVNAATRGLQLNQGEFKSVDTAGVIAMNTAPGVVVLLNGIARGDDINQRNGREVTMKSIQFTHQTSGGAADSFCRFLIVYDRQSNGAALTAAMVLNLADVVSPRNLENRKRFKILHDRLYTVETAANPMSLKCGKFYRRLRHPITFNTGNAGTVADIATGSLYLIALGSNAAGGNASQFSYTCRIRYLDN